MVAAGILLSRISGLVRQRVLSQFLGLSPAADAFNAAFRIPNILQNLFGEGVLSASFIPAYARLRAEGREEDARRLAGAVFGAGSLLVAVLVAVGVTLTPWLVSALFPGFEGSQRLLTIQLVRILFPGMGLLVLSAWCLSILNSHRKFFLSYAAPVLWNIAIIAATLAAGAGRPLEGIVVWSAWGAVVGSALQFLVQLPVALRLTRGLQVSLGRGDPHVGRVFGTFLPALVTRGVTQISAFIDGILASLLPSGAITALANAQTLYSLPVSLFGMSVSAAELPELSAAAIGGERSHGALRERLENASRRVAFFVIPTAVGFVALGQVVTSLLFQAGRFGPDDARYVWGILAGATIGLLATTQGRLYSSVFYALHDTRTPLRYAGLRVLLASAVGYLAAIQLPPVLGLAPRWGAAGITAATGLAGWVEFLLLRRSLSARIGRIQVGQDYLARLWGPAIVAGGVGWLIMRQVGDAMGPIPRAALVLAPFGIIYLLGTAFLNVPLARELIDRVRRRA